MKKTTPLQRARDILSDLNNRRRTGPIMSHLLRKCRLWVDGNYTVALINNKYIGVAKRNPIDKYNAFSGESFAISRAVKKFREDRLEDW